MHNSASSLKTLCTVESEQFYSTFSPTTIRLTWHCHKNAKYSSTFLPKTHDSKKHSYEDNAKFHSAFLLTALSYATSFQFLYVWTNLKKIFESVGYIVLGIC
jgi:hypothetical protein